jgi:beta-lactamase class A
MTKPAEARRELIPDTGCSQGSHLAVLSTGPARADCSCGGGPTRDNACEDIHQGIPGTHGISVVLLFLHAWIIFCGCASTNTLMDTFQNYVLDQNSPVSATLQRKLEEIDSELRGRFGMAPAQTAIGVLDLKLLRLAMIHPDRGEYAASIPKIGILLAYFQVHSEAATNLNAQTRHELGLMIKASDNEMAAKFSREIGLKRIQAVLGQHQFYDAARGGGIWMGKHYGKSDERYGDPVGDNSHAATVRQLLRYFLLLEQGKLVSPEASKTMREVFEWPDIPHDNIKFVQGLDGEQVQVIRKWGSWQDWLHDSAVVSGPNRHYILVGLTHHPKGDEYLVELARAVDVLLQKPQS